ncbi:hypothetical protein [Pseudoduganella sp. R-34]|uniref:hypothetical protein n=1 Tax=Pseudoduganella sp. R-34 TaxID=3404062 RepID=UPI003CF081C3
MSQHVSVTVTLPTLRDLLDYQAEKASDQDFSGLVDRAMHVAKPVCQGEPWYRAQCMGGHLGSAPGPTQLDPSNPIALFR